MNDKMRACLRNGGAAEAGRKFNAKCEFSALPLSEQDDIISRIEGGALHHFKGLTVQELRERQDLDWRLVRQEESERRADERWREEKRRYGWR